MDSNEQASESLKLKWSLIDNMTNYLANYYLLRSCHSPQFGEYNRYELRPPIRTPVALQISSPSGTSFNLFPVSAQGWSNAMPHTHLATHLNTYRVWVGDKTRLK